MVYELREKEVLYFDYNSIQKTEFEHFLRMEENRLVSSAPIMESRGLEPQELTMCQYESCSCYLKHFEYMRRNLKYYLEDHPDDRRGMSFYIQAKSFNGPAFNQCKIAMTIAIQEHLKKQNLTYFKYFYDPKKYDPCNLEDQGDFNNK